MMKAAPQQPRTLRLTLKRQWFDLVAADVKKEEYRTESPWILSRLEGKDYDQVEFKNGYGADVPAVTLEFLGWRRGTGRAEWGCDGKRKIVIRLGKILISKNLKS